MAKIENWIKHELASRLDPKMRGLLMRFGFLGYGLFWVIVEELYNATDHLLPYPSADAIEWQIMANDGKISEDQIREIVDYCLKIKLLQQLGDNITSNKVLVESEARRHHQSRISEVRSIAGKAGAQAVWSKSNNSKPLMANAKQMPSSKMANDGQRERERDREKDAIFCHNLKIRGKENDPDPMGFSGENARKPTEEEKLRVKALIESKFPSSSPK